MPLLAPRIQREYKNLSDLDPAALPHKRLPIKSFTAEQQREIVFRDLNTDAQSHVTAMDTAFTPNYQNMIGFFTRTFTDCVYLAGGRLQVLKVFSTPADPAQAVLDGLERIGAGKALDVRHGTTVGTNTMLERKGARVAFVTTAGFEDTIAIGRQTRSKLYDWFVPLPVCLVPRALRFGVPERVSAEGEILRAPTEEELDLLVNQVRGSGAEAIAISLLFSFANPETERA